LANKVKELTMTKDLRAIIYHSCHEMITKKDVKNIEQKIMKCNLGWKYKKTDLTGKTKDRKHGGGCIAELVVVKKATLLQPVHHATKMVHYETIMWRLSHQAKKKVEEAKLSAVIGERLGANAALDRQKRKKSKKTPEPPLMSYQRALHKTHGFNGWIYYYQGHPSLVADSLTAGAVQVGNGEKNATKSEVVDLMVKTFNPQELIDLVQNLQANDAGQRVSDQENAAAALVSLQQHPRTPSQSSPRTPSQSSVAATSGAGNIVTNRKSTSSKASQQSFSPLSSSVDDHEFDNSWIDHSGFHAVDAEATVIDEGPITPTFTAFPTSIAHHGHHHYDDDDDVSCIMFLLCIIPT
jgi:hypothetical protein